MLQLLSRIAAATVLLCFALQAVAAIKLDDKVPPNNQVRIGKLANGFTYFIQRNPLPAKRLELRLIVKAGSVLEDPDQLGLAHFVEHLAFNGSTNFKKNELVAYFEKVGIKFGNDLNAYTSFDETVYMLPVPTDNKEDVAKAFLVLEDWAHGIKFEQEDVDGERNILLEEARSRKGVQQRFQRLTFPKIFAGSRYAERLPIGSEEILRTAKADTIKRFYKDWYRPDLMAVVAVGDIEPDEIERMVKLHFNKLSNPSPARVRAYPEIPARTTAEGMVLTDKEASQNVLSIHFGAVPLSFEPTFRALREGAIRVLVQFMVGERTRALSRLEKSPFIGGGVSFSRQLRHLRTFSAQAVVGSAGLDAAVNALVEETERMRRHGFSAGEFERARTNLLRMGELAAQEENKRKSAVLASDYQRHFVHDEIIPSPSEENAYLKELLAGISLSDVNAFARDTLPHNAPKLVIFEGTEKQASPLPDGAKLLAMVDAAAKREVAAVVDKALPKTLMEKIPQPGSIVAEQQDDKLGLTHLTLSNGLKVILKQTTFKNNQVLLEAQRFGGSSLVPEADLMTARNVLGIAASQGFGGFTPEEAEKITTGKSYSISMGFGEQTERLGAAAATSDLESMFQALHLRFSGMNRNEAIFRGQMTRLADATRNQMASPAMKFQAALLDAMGGGHPRATRLQQPEDFASISFERAVQIYKERFSSAKGFDFVIVGSFDIAEMKRLLQTYVATLPTTDLVVAARDTGLRAPKGLIQREVRAGIEAKSSLAMVYATEAPFSYEDSHRVRALAEIMTLRITDVLREKNALIYGGGMQGMTYRYPVPTYRLGSSLQFAPENADKVSKLLKAEIEKLKTEGPTETDLHKFKQNFSAVRARALKENGFWANMLAVSLLNGEKPDRELQAEDEVKKLTVAELKEAANRYFGPNLIEVKLLPEK
jgi:zinc protease